MTTNLPENDRPWHILPVIALAQFMGTSLWFAGNAVMVDLQQEWSLEEGALGMLTSSVQLGFIAGSLLFAVFNVADRLSPRLVFAVCASMGAAANAAVALGVEGLNALLVLRFVVGLCLAGIYPVGMKIAASWFAKGLGQALGLLVGALVLGTAFPHLLRMGGLGIAWRTALLAVSGMAVAGGLLLYALVPPGPHLRAKTSFDPRALGRIFKKPEFRSAAFGYFGHMWELYAFWALLPALLTALAAHHSAALNVPLWSFAIIAVGGLGCTVGGIYSKRVGSARIAALGIGLSGLLCLLSPLLFFVPLPVALAALVLWGIAVVMDSPQFSALNATTAPRELVGTALTIVTSVGFAITIPSILALSWLAQSVGPQYAFVALAAGPILGLLALRRSLVPESSA